jgi:hypothetical protein
MTATSDTNKTKNSNVRFDIFIAVIMWKMMFLAMMLCCFVGTYKRSWGSHCLYLPALMWSEVILVQQYDLTISPLPILPTTVPTMCSKQWPVYPLLFNVFQQCAPMTFIPTIVQWCVPIVRPRVPLLQNSSLQIMQVAYSSRRNVTDIHTWRPVRCSLFTPECEETQKCKVYELSISHFNF